LREGRADALKEGNQQGHGIGEHPRDEGVGISAEAGGRCCPQSEAALGEKEKVTLSYREFRSYSVKHGCEVAWIGVSEPGKQPHFTIIPNPGGKGWRDRKNDALHQLTQAIERGEEPGEIQCGL
jgi:hypothetical protein